MVQSKEDVENKVKLFLHDLEKKKVDVYTLGDIRREAQIHLASMKDSIRKAQDSRKALIEEHTDIDKTLIKANTLIEKSPFREKVEKMNNIIADLDYENAVVNQAAALLEALLDKVFGMVNDVADASLSKELYKTHREYIETTDERREERDIRERRRMELQNEKVNAVLMARMEKIETRNYELLNKLSERERTEVLLATANKTNIELSAKIAQLEGHKEEWEKKFEELDKSVSQSKGQNLVLKEKLETVRMERDELQKQIQDLMAERAVAQRLMENLGKPKKNVKEKLQKEEEPEEETPDGDEPDEDDEVEDGEDSDERDEGNLPQRNMGNKKNPKGKKQAKPDLPF